MEGNLVGCFFDLESAGGGGSSDSDVGDSSVDSNGNLAGLVVSDSQCSYESRSGCDAMGCQGDQAGKDDGFEDFVVIGKLEFFEL